MQEIYSIETIPLIEAAKILHTQPEKINAAILNGTFPVGIATEGGAGSRRTTIILKKRFEAYINALDLKKV